jgi:hypothetical protein
MTNNTEQRKTSEQAPRDAFDIWYNENVKYIEPVDVHAWCMAAWQAAIAQREQVGGLPDVELTDLTRIDRLAKNPKILGDRLYGKWFLRNREYLLTAAPAPSLCMAEEALLEAYDVIEAEFSDVEAHAPKLAAAVAIINADRAKR